MLIMRAACPFQFPNFKKSNFRTKTEKLWLMSKDLDKTVEYVKHPFPPIKTSCVYEQEYGRELQEVPLSFQSF